MFSALTSSRAGTSGELEQARAQLPNTVAAIQQPLCEQVAQLQRLTARKLPQAANLSVPG